MDDRSAIREFWEITTGLTAPGAPFETCRAETDGALVYRHAPTNIHDVLVSAELKFGARDFLFADDRPMTFGEVFAAGRRLAVHLRHRQGVKAGDHLGLAMRNRPEWFIAYAALARLGAVAVLLNSRDSAEQSAHSAAAVGCGLVIADADRAARLSEGGFKGRLLVVDEPGGAFDALGAEDLGEVPAAAVETDAPAAILFTSGTSGRPKGAVLTHRNLCNMIMNMRFGAAHSLATAARRAGLGDSAPQSGTMRSSTLMVFPMFHISGVSVFFGALISGGTIHFMRRWDARRAVEMIERFQIAAVSGPPLVLDDLVGQPGASERLASLKGVVVGGQATPANLVHRVGAVLPGAVQSQSWGMTELTGVATTCREAVFMSAPDSCGPPVPIAEVEVRDDERRPLGVREVGDLWVRSGTAMRGYWNAPEANAATFDEGRWLNTGDVGYLDEEGFVFLVDRKKDMVISGGENIYCAEVERVLALDLDFIEVSLFGAPDARLGERAIAAVTLRPGARRTEAAVRDFVRERLADYKAPAEVVFDLGPFPRNSTGKVDKKALRRMYLERISVGG
jgi:long-chain acyl-CoA synthetase